MDRLSHARAFRELMNMRWGITPALSLAELTGFWNIDMNNTQYLSRNALRVAATLDIPRTVEQGCIVLTFDDGSVLRSTVLGDRFL